MALFNPLSNAFGLDIGDRTFKVVQFSKHAHSRKTYRLTAWGSVVVPEGIMERGEVLNMTKAVEHIRRAVSSTQGRLRGRAVVACLPEAKSFVKIIEADKGLSREELRQIVIKEIGQSIPLPINDIYYDWQVLPEKAEPRPKAEPAPAKKEETPGAEAAAGSAAPAVGQPAPAGAAPETPAASETAPPAEGAGSPAEAAEGTPPAEGEAAPAEAGAGSEEVPEAEAPQPKRDVTRILLAAAPRNLIDAYCQMLEAAGLAPIAFEVEGVAIARAVVPANELINEAIGILDIGATRSSLIVFDEDVLQMSISIPLSGNELTKIISEKLSITVDDAELLKIECGLDAHRCEDRMWRILLPLIDDMSSKIRNALRFYKIGFPMGKKIERLYLCGGGAHFRDIDTVLSRKLTIKVRRGDSLCNVQAVPRAFPRENALTYATAIGLGLRAADENDRYRSSFRV